MRNKNNKAKFKHSERYSVINFKVKTSSFNCSMNKNYIFFKMFGKRGKQLKSVDYTYGQEPRHIEISDSSDQSDNEREQRSPTPSCYSVKDFYIDSDDDSDGKENRNSENQVSNKNSLYRWKQRNMAMRKVNIIKNKRAESLPYETSTGLKKAKTPKKLNCTKCRFKCNLHFTEGDRKKICSVYWAMNNYKRQKDFILKCIKVSSVKRRTTSENHSSRSESRAYNLFNGQRQLWRVCAKFFQKTLCISNGPINVALSSINACGNFEGDDKRGKKPPGNKTSNHSINIVKQHIESFSTVPGHYIRQSSQKKYLDSNLSILKMYELYQIYCSTLNEIPVKENVYRRVFCTQYNLSFFTPKKDQCTICTRFELADSVRKEQLQEEYDLHINRKDDCYMAKNLDKQRSTTQDNFQTVTFDLQSVLQIPSSASSQMYYSRKINVYNLTVYESGHDKKALCYAWNELNGKRGSSEIGSILFKYINSIPQNITELSLFSDTCGGQNRNQNVAAILLYAVRSTHLQVIEQKFLESGHTYMECDSMHSSIEHSKKYRSVFIMNDWLEIFKAARSTRGKNKNNDPYEVNEIKYFDFLNLQKLCENLIKNRNIDEDGKKVSWLKVKCVRYQKTDPNTIFYRYDHTAPYKKICVHGRGRPPNVLAPIHIYENELPISEAKKKDLLKLCASGVIPVELHQWYKNLPTLKSAKDFEDENVDE